MIPIYTQAQRDRHERHGYKWVHLFGRLHLVRNYSVNARKFSLYGLAILKKETI